MALPQKSPLLDRIRAFFTRDRKLMLLSLLLAFMLWIPSKLNKPYEHRLDIPITLIPPEGMTVAYTSDDHALIQLKGRGARLIGLRGDIEKVPFVIQVTEARHDLPFVLSTQAMAKAFRDSFELSDQVSVEVQGSGITYRFAEEHTKSVPVVPILDISCANGFGLSGPPTTTPSHITIQGTALEVGATDTLYTDTISLEDLKQPTSIRSTLATSPSSTMKMRTDEVTVQLDISPILDKTVTITLPDYTTGEDTWQLYPDHIEVHVAVPSALEQRFDASTIQTTYTSMGKQALLVNVKKVPPFTTYIAHSPKVIRYFMGSDSTLAKVDSTLTREVR